MVSDMVQENSEETRYRHNIDYYLLLAAWDLLYALFIDKSEM